VPAHSFPLAAGSSMRMTARTTPSLSALGCALVLSLSVACAAPSQSTTPAAGGKKVDAATAGTITGKITFEGQRPAVELVRMASDAGCVQGAGPNPQSDAVLIANDGGLQNVFVYIKDGLDPAYTFDVPTDPVILDQKGCFYAPRVLGVRAGQSLEVSNDDPTFHNVHAMPKMNMEFNQGLNVRGSRLRRTFTTPEVMVRFKCDVHGWMAAWLGVVSHPYFAVTGADGSFSLKGVPPGTYTVEAWHERFGTKLAQVTVAANQTGTASFTFSSN
jgi:plastocyanin